MLEDSNINKKSFDIQELARRVKELKNVLKVPLEGLPNDFSDGDTIVYKSFPWLFPLARGVLMKPLLTKNATRHMLLQFNNQFSKDTEFIFSMFNLIQRHEISRMVVPRFKVASKNVIELENLVNDSGFTNLLARLMKNSESKDTTDFIKKIERILYPIQQFSCFTEGERRLITTKLKSMLTHYGLPSWFLTIAPAYKDNFLLMRFALKNHSNQEILKEFPIYSKRCTFVGKYPGLSAIVFE